MGNFSNSRHEYDFCENRNKTLVVRQPPRGTRGCGRRVGECERSCVEPSHRWIILLMSISQMDKVVSIISDFFKF
jgi:hypothetical protein